MSFYNSYGKQILAGVAGSALFLYTKTGIPAPEMFMYSDWVISSAIGLLGTIGFQTALPRTTTLQDQIQSISEGSGEDVNQVAEVIEFGRTKVSSIRGYINQLPEETRDKVTYIADTAEKILDGFLDDPSDIKRSKNFLNHYLESTEDILNKYSTLYEKGASVQKFNQLKQKFDTTLDEIGQAFQKQYEKNMQDDMFNLDVDLDVLKKMIKQEGL